MTGVGGELWVLETPMSVIKKYDSLLESLFDSGLCVTLFLKLCFLRSGFSEQV